MSQSATQPVITCKLTREPRSVHVAAGHIDCIFERIEFFADGKKTHEVWSSFGYDCRGLGEWAAGEYFRVGDQFKTQLEAELACSLKLHGLLHGEVRNVG